MTDLSQRLAALSPEKRALLEQRLQRRESTAPDATALSDRPEPIAIVGFGCRFPGARGPAEFWQLLEGGKDAITEVPPERWDAERLYHRDPRMPGKMASRWGGFLEGIDRFDARFFGISPREAVQMDPQQRLLLEVGWEALEEAGLPPTSLAGSDTGVFIGSMSADYGQTRHVGLTSIDAYSGPGGSLGITASRLSYQLDLHGPSLAVDSACSSSLVAVHLACQSLRAGECGLALAGGVNVLLWPGHTIYFTKAGLIAADGRCKAFDARADGIVRGEGAGVLVLKRLSRALADGDRIRAVIRGSAVVQDGQSNGLTAPNPRAQETTLRQAYRQAGLDPAKVQYVEAHGTGTELGDPIEAQALGAVVGAGREAGAACRLGSVKSNFGHLEAAAGVAGLIKTVLCLEHRRLAPSIHCEEPNPQIDFAGLGLEVNRRLEPWPAHEGKALAGVSSFGFGGTNAHVILEEAPAQAGEPSPPRPYHLLALSARSMTALRSTARRHARYLESAVGTDPAALADACFTAHTGRSHLTYRAAVSGADGAELGRHLEALAAGDEGGHAAGAQALPKIAFLFTGQGAQYAGMGRELWQSHAPFRRSLERSSEILRPHLEVSLAELCFGYTAQEGRLQDTRFTQPVLTAFAIALVELWKSWGVAPHSVLGHSVGQLAAAWAAGVLSRKDVLTFAAERGRLMASLPAEGVMAAVRCGEQEVLHLLEEKGAGKVSLAAVNGPESSVIAGEGESVRQVLVALATRGITGKELEVSHAFHSHLMEPILPSLEQTAACLTHAPARIQLIADSTGLPLDESIEEPGAWPAYWRRHARQPIRFAEGVQSLLDAGCGIFVEIGPQPTLIDLSRRFVPEGQALWLPSLRRRGGDWRQLMESLARLYARGVAIDWRGFHSGEVRRRRSLPTYPFEGQRYWLEAATASVTEPLPFPGRRLFSPALAETAVFEGRLSLSTMPSLGDHRVGGQPVVAGAVQLSMAMAVVREVHGAADVCFEDVAFENPLVVADEAGSPGRKVQLVLGAGPEALLRIFSQEGGSETCSEKWTLHSRLHLAAAEGEAPQGDAEAPAAIRERCPEVWERSRILEHHAAQGLGIGPSMQWVDRLWRRDGEAVGRVVSPESPAEEAAASLWPSGLLDSGLRLLAAALPASEEAAYLPVGISRLRWAAPESLEDLWGHAVLDRLEENGTARGSVRLVEGEGRVLLEAEGIRLRRMSPEHLLHREDEAGRPEAGVFQQEWIPMPLPERTEAGAEARGRYLILADRGGVGAAVAARLRALGAAVTLAYATLAHAGSEGDGAGETVAAEARWVDPSDPEAMRQLLQPTPGGLPWSGLLHLWSLDVPAAAGSALSTSALEGAQLPPLAGALHLFQALSRHAASAAPLWLVTRGVVPTPDGAPSAVGQASLWGVGAVFASELPELPVVRLDLPAAKQAEPKIDEDAALLLAEVAIAPAHGKGQGEEQVAYLGGRRHVARLAPRDVGSGLPRIQAERCYLVTGGLGALGLEVARWLVRRGARHLALVGRRQPGPRAAAVLEQLRAEGVQVSVLAADVTLHHEVRSLLSELAGTQPPLAGVIHAAGVLDDAILVQQDWERFRAVLAPKVSGAWNLHQLTREMELDFFVLFSSAAPLLGTAGQGAYAAGNVFLDRLAQHRQALGLPALSVAWGPWSAENGGGMAADRGLLESWRQRGIDALAPEEALASLEHLLAERLAVATVIRADWQRLARSWQGGRLPGWLAALGGSESGAAQGSGEKAGEALRERLRSLPARERREALLDLVREEARRVLRLGAGEALDDSRSLFDAGLDSLMALELRGGLQQALGENLPSTLVFDHPSIDALARFLDEGLVRPESVEAESESQAEPAGSRAEDLEALEEDELEAMLLRRVQALKQRGGS